MKIKLQYLITIMAFLLLTASTANAQLFQQTFTNPLLSGIPTSTIITNQNVTSDANYISATPSNTQFTFMGTSSTTSSITINGSDGLLRMARTGGTAQINRISNFTGNPTTLKVTFDLSVISSGASSTMMQFMVGSGFTNAIADPTNKHSLFWIGTTSAANTWGVSATGTTPTFTYNTSQLVSWFINNSGSSITYTAPDGSNPSLPDDTYDVWVGTRRICFETHHSRGFRGLKCT